MVLLSVRKNHHTTCFITIKSLLGNLIFGIIGIIINQLEEIWRKTSVFFFNGRQPQFFPMKDNLIFSKWKTTSIFLSIEDNLQKTKIKQPKTIKMKTIGQDKAFLPFFYRPWSNQEEMGKRLQFLVIMGTLFELLSIRETMFTNRTSKNRK